MAASSEDIKAMLVADSSVNTTKFPINRVMFDASKTNCATIIDIASGSPQLTLDNAMYEFASVQFRVMCSDYDDGWDFISSVVSSLHGRANEVYNGTYYSLISCLNGPGFLERINQRTILVANFNIQRRKV